MIEKVTLPGLLVAGDHQRSCAFVVVMQQLIMACFRNAYFQQQKSVSFISTADRTKVRLLGVVFQN